MRRDVCALLALVLLCAIPAAFAEAHYDAQGHLVDEHGNAHVDVHVDGKDVHVDSDLSQPADPTNVEDMKMAQPETPQEKAGVKSSAPFLMDGPLKFVQFAGQDKKTVFVITSKNHLFRSVDAGFTFHAAAEKLDTASGIQAMYHSPADPSVLFFLGTDHMHWITRDLGESYQQVKWESGKLLEVEFHPTQAGWLLAATFSPECAATGANAAPTVEPPPVDENGNAVVHDGCNRVLLVSRDFAKTFEPILKYTIQFAWAPKGRNENLIFATTLMTKSGHQKFGKWTSDASMVSSEDYFKTMAVVVENANRMLFSRYFLFAATVDPADPAQVKILVNRDNATSTHFEKIQLPVELTQHSYSLLDSSEGSVFLHINHMGDNAKMGMVYASDAAGQAYSLSLPNNRRNANGVCDFEKVEGVEGIYVANFIEEHQTMESPPSESMSEQSATKPQEQLKIDQLTKTVITFDKGGEWVYLKAPEHDAHGKKYECAGGQCNLHLNGVTSSFGPFYSTATAIGLMLGTGNVGAHLREDLDAMNVYFSRDAGLTWFEIATGSHIYEFGNHGGIILMANNHAATQNIVYSFDEGLTWNFHKISDTPIHVDNIIVEPRPAGQIFLVYGRAEEAGVIVQIDFRELHERVCSGADAPNLAASDYEEWSPSDGRSKSCLLGHTITYVRRKRDHKCYNGDEHAPTRSYEHCACTDANFECDFGFHREFTETGQAGACIRDMAAKTLAAAGPPPQCDGFYLASKGYRRIAGDTCVGGSEFLPALTPCAAGYSHSGHVGTVLLVVLSLMVLSLCAVTVANRYEPLRNFLLGVREKFGDISYGKIETSASAAASTSIMSGDDHHHHGGSGHVAIGAHGALGGAPDSMLDADDDDDFGLDDEVGGVHAPQLMNAGQAVEFSAAHAEATKADAAKSEKLPARSFAPLPAPAQPKEVKVPILQPHAADDFDPRA